MLVGILAAIATAGRPLCLADLRRELGIEESALEGMLDTLVARGRVRPIHVDASGCGVCPVRGGCFVMAEGAAVSYVLSG